MFWVGLIIGGLVGVILMALLSAGKVNELQDESYNAELRAVTHFRKLNAIENLIKKDEENHEFVVNTIKKIKEIIA